MDQEPHKADVIRLLMEHRDALFGYILAVTRDFDAAEDVFQEMSVAVCESYAQFQPGTQFKAWAREIARRRILAQRRAAGRSMNPLDENVVDVAFARVDADGPPAERIDALRNCLQRLSPWVRRLVELRYAAQMSLEHIAEQVGRQPDSVRKTLYRGRQVLRECIEGRLHLEDVSP